MSTSLVRYDAMCRAIAEAYKVDEVKDIRDKARAIEQYSRQAKNTEAERQACEIRLRAERKCGQLLADMEKAKGSAQPGIGRRGMQSSDVTALPQQTLTGLGISKQQSSDWQKLAAVPDADFEVALTHDRPTTTGIIAAHAPAKPRDQVDAKALWLWGRLLDFQREGLLDLDPKSLLTTMLQHMQDTTKELAPRVAAWLERISHD